MWLLFGKQLQVQNASIVAASLALASFGSCVHVNVSTPSNPIPISGQNTKDFASDFSILATVNSCQISDVNNSFILKPKQSKQTLDKTNETKCLHRET